ncbi:MAG: peptidylprolyl isomerase [Gammaproteobacteria bacterium]|nr:peptidylprolyl isomerase [Gammaproteobacteria bacterium]
MEARHGLGNRIFTLHASQSFVLITKKRKFKMAKANARHILVSSEEECNNLKQQIIDGADFAEIASAHSQCPSGKQGGDLGSFSPGQMVPEFDTVVFNEAVGEVHGPVETQFGYHLIEITSRDS